MKIIPLRKKFLIAAGNWLILMVCFIANSDVVRASNSSILAQFASEAEPLGPESQEQRTQWEQGVAYYQAGDAKAAIALWQQALQQDSRPQSQILLLSSIALAQQQQQDWGPAKVALDQAQVLLDNRSPEVNLPEAQRFQSLQARVLNVRGRWYWSQNQLESAQREWQAAAATYAQAQDIEGQLLASLNHAQALMALGFNTQAETLLLSFADQLQAESRLSGELRTAGAISLGSALRHSGKLEQSQQLLRESLDTIPSISKQEQAKLLLELGNGERALRGRWQTLGKSAKASASQTSAMRLYKQVETITDDPVLQWQGRLNRLALLIDAQAPEAVALASQFQNALPPAMAKQPTSRQAVQLQLNLVESLIALGQDPEPLLGPTLAEAKALSDPAMIAYALGQRGTWFEQQQQWGKARQWTEQALLALETVQIPSLRYRWEWQLGRVMRQQGEVTGAIAAYQDAVRSLEAVRGDLLSIQPELQFSFRDDVEPVYRELVGLLLDESMAQNMAQNNLPSQAVLKQAIQQVDALQLAELENFLGCRLAQTVELGAVTADPTAAKVYPLILQDRLAVILEPPGQQSLQYHEVRLSEASVQKQLRQLRRDLAVPGRTPEAIAGLQTVHQWLIEPFEATLGDEVETLVFVLDGDLRNVPMAALYDGEDYLISRYAVALSPRLQLFNPRPRTKEPSVFLGGVGQPQTLEGRSFPEISYLEAELDGIRELSTTSQPLLNTAFTKSNLIQSLSEQPFSGVHIKTHGVFSSNPEETFVVAHGEVLTGLELGSLLRGRSGRAGTLSPVELLVLSACSTAQGDSRAVLGIAGLAVQAGAQSVVSTLWEAQDVPNTLLMLRFYEALQDPELTRAEALRVAQLSLLEEGYRTPHVWATYVLVGNWL